MSEKNISVQKKTNGIKRFIYIVANWTNVENINIWRYFGVIRSTLNGRNVLWGKQLSQGVF